jgi:hypothetical protein
MATVRLRIMFNPRRPSSILSKKINYDLYRYHAAEADHLKIQQKSSRTKIKYF